MPLAGTMAASIPVERERHWASAASKGAHAYSAQRAKTNQLSDPRTTLGCAHSLVRAVRPLARFRLARWLYALCWTGTHRPDVLFDHATAWLVTEKALRPSDQEPNTARSVKAASPRRGRFAPR